ncbi:bola protein [Mycena pura]|uniref:Bola protein n=1 Tax=Mycena pura TaxID=153505 RepID=A0AAD6YUA6_9AGAR|nr:bola protein [Mycena pura]
MFAYPTRRWPLVALQIRRLSAVKSIPPTEPSKEHSIHQKLSERFSPSHLEIEDISGGCGTFFAISIASEVFKGIPMVKQHQLVTQTLKTEIEAIHGLQVRRSPSFIRIYFISIRLDKNQYTMIVASA